MILLNKLCVCFPSAELYKNDVEINDDVRHAFGDAYWNQFEVNDE